MVPLVEEEEEAGGGGQERQALWLVEKPPLSEGKGAAALRRTRVMPVIYVPLVKEAAGAPVAAAASTVVGRGN